jgi:hypothetical protein
MGEEQDDDAKKIYEGAEINNVYGKSHAHSSVGSYYQGTRSGS